MATKSRPVAAVELHRIEADLAAINVRLDVIERGLQTLTHHVDGNGKPGLMERVQAHDLALEGLKSTMEAVGSQLGRLEEMRVELLEKGQAEHQAIIRQVELLADRLDDHTNPENMRHQTLARAFMANPGLFLQYAGWVLAGILLLVDSGVVEKLITWLASRP